LKKQVHISYDSATSRLPLKAYQSLPTVRNLAILLFLISICVYANTLTNGYVLDDFAAIKENALVQKGVSAIPDLFTTPYHSGYVKTNLTTPAVNDLYRPLSLITFATELQLFGESPAISHGFNVLLFAGCVLLLFLFFDRLFGGEKTTIAFVASLLFAVHPIHSEVVANIKSRDELLCFFFALSSILSFINYARSGKTHLLLAGTVLYFLSLLSKETSLSFLAIVPLVFFFYINRNKKRSIYITAATAITGIAYLLIRQSVLKLHAADDLSNLAFIDNALAGAPSIASRISSLYPTRSSATMLTIVSRLLNSVI
jgi:protein O-mannosyl-transferase